MIVGSGKHLIYCYLLMETFVQYNGKFVEKFT